MTLGQNSPGRDLRNRYLVLGAVMMVGLLTLVIQAYRLQITRYAEFAAKSEANFIKEVRLRADRGMIRDARGEILVDNRPSFDLFVTPAFCDQCATEVLPRALELARIPAEELEGIAAKVAAARRKAPFVPFPIKVDLGREEVDRISAHKRQLPGVDLVPVPHRYYRTGTVMSHLLGYMNEITQEELERLAKSGTTYHLGDYIGRRGLERYFESELRGKEGLRKEVVTARGETVPGLADLIQEEAIPPTPGNNLVLSIDMRLQAEAERAFPGVAGAVIAIDVRTGFIRAMVSRPGFDPNVLTGRVTPAQMAAVSKDPLQPMIFRPTAQHYSPGSTFKPITALAALRSGQFSPHTQTYCGGGYRLGSRVWRCHKDAGHGHQDVRDALKHSCNVYFFRVADTLGLDPIAAEAKALGLGQPTGIGVVAEVPGIMPTSEYHDRVSPGGYTKGMALNASVGQGDDNVTPLQLAMAYAAIANGGTLYQPQLVQRIERTDGTLLQEFKPQVVRNAAIAEEHRRVVVDALSAVVNEPGGTAYRLRLKDVQVAGKTGTAQVARIGQVRLKTSQMDYFLRHHAWFASFAPVQDPELVVVVLNEHGGGGGTDAAPTAFAVIQKYFELKAEDAGITVASAASSPIPESIRQAIPPIRPVSAVPPEVTAPSVREAAQAAQEAAARAGTEMSTPKAQGPIEEIPLEAVEAGEPGAPPSHVAQQPAVAAPVLALPLGLPAVLQTLPVNNRAPQLEAVEKPRPSPPAPGPERSQPPAP
ncbi:MAG: penicillin-binding protein 2 [Myxococcota bacterium]|nr:penicillin-binding protein 2 [Myxococcota bacterium]